MTYRGRVRNGVIVLDEPAALPEGAEVDVTPTRSGNQSELPPGTRSDESGSDLEDDASQPTWAEVFKDIIGKAEGLPADSSINHDHYLYGTPKK